MELKIWRRVLLRDYMHVLINVADVEHVEYMQYVTHVDHILFIYFSI